MKLRKIITEPGLAVFEATGGNSPKMLVVRLDSGFAFQHLLVQKLKAQHLEFIAENKLDLPFEEILKDLDEIDRTEVYIIEPREYY